MTPFVVLKGYHVGSTWFARAFNALPGCSFFFEFEHCFTCSSVASLHSTTHLATDDELNARNANLTIDFFARSCGCSI